MSLLLVGKLWFCFRVAAFHPCMSAGARQGSKWCFCAFYWTGLSHRVHVQPIHLPAHTYPIVDQYVKFKSHMHICIKLLHLPVTVLRSGSTLYSIELPAQGAGRLTSWLRARFSQRTWVQLQASKPFNPSLQLPVTSGPRDPMPLSGFCGY